MARPKKRLEWSKHEHDQFWLVWRHGSSNARYQHYSYDLAKREASRLAAEYPGEEFFVMKAMAGFVCPVQPIQKIRLEYTPPQNFVGADSDDDGIPF